MTTATPTPTPSPAEVPPASPTEPTPPIIAKALAIFFGTKREDWRMVNQAAVHKDAVIGKAAEINGEAFIRGGTIWGGTIWGGTIRGGTIWGGTIRGGTIRGGTIRKSLLCIFGLCAWPATIGRHGEVSIGCQCHTAEHWRANIAEIAEKHEVDEDEQARVLQAVELVQKWIEANPDAVGPDEPVTPNESR